MKAYIEAASFYAPGVQGWENLDAVVSGPPQYEPQADTKYAPLTLPRNEKRRASVLTRLVFRLGEQIRQQATWADFANVATVFASAGGDYDIQHKINTALAQQRKQLSPTEFHNSVHNAAGGYWGIASACHAPSVSISGGEHTVARGLFEAVLNVTATDQTIMLIVADIEPPFPLSGKQPISMPMGAALLLAPRPGPAARYELDVSTGVNPGDAATSSEVLKSLADASPVAAVIPLFEAFARRGQSRLHFSAPPGITIATEALPQ